MGNGDRKSLEQPQGHEPALVIGVAIIWICEGGAFKYCLGINEVDFVIPQVRQAFLLVPEIPHLRSVYTPDA